jgi:hypothetical protein
MNPEDIIYIKKIKNQNKKYKGKTTKRVREEKRKKKSKEETPENKQRKTRNRGGGGVVALASQHTIINFVALGNACFLN